MTSDTKIVEDSNLRVEISREIGCQRCGGTARQQIVERAKSGVLSYSIGESCADCGFGIEVDGKDLPPDLRAVLIQATGMWRLVLVGWEDRMRAWREIKSMFQLSNREARALLRVGSVLARGTRVEVANLHMKLMADGIQTELQMS